MSPSRHGFKNIDGHARGLSPCTASMTGRVFSLHHIKPAVIDRRYRGKGPDRLRSTAGRSSRRSRSFPTSRTWHVCSRQVQLLIGLSGFVLAPLFFPIASGSRSRKRRWAYEFVSSAVRPAGSVTRSCPLLPDMTRTMEGAETGCGRSYG